MNTLLKITISLVFLILTGCVHHSRHYSDQYDYNRGYNSYDSYPVYYERDVYVQPHIYGQKRNSHKGQHDRHYDNPKKHQKPNHRYNEYGQPSKHKKPYVNKQFLNSKHKNKTKKYVTKNNSSTKKFKPKFNNSLSPSPSRNKREQSDHKNYSTNSQPSDSESKHLKSNEGFSSQRSHSGKGFKR